MRRFLYLRDPLFLTGCAAYALNRWLIKPHVHTVFLHAYFNDCWLIPCALPPLLWLHRKLGLRPHDRAPQFSEIALHLVFWSALFEWIGPKFVAHTTADPMDVVAYAAGALVAGLWWQRERWLRPALVQTALPLAPGPEAKGLQRLNGLTAGEATHFLRTEDRSRERYARQHFHRAVDDALAYHLVINTDPIPLSHGPRVIQEGARQCFGWRADR